MAGSRTRRNDGTAKEREVTSRAVKRTNKRSRSPEPKTRAADESNSSTLIPTQATSAHRYIQRMTCQSLRKNGADISQCQSCIERRNDSGGCRFAGFRAFKLLEAGDKTGGGDASPPVTPEPLRGDVKLSNKKRKLNNYPPLPPGLDYRNYALVGDRPAHRQTEIDKNCLYSTSVPLGRSLRPASTADSYILSKVAPTIIKGLKRELKHEERRNHPIIRIAEDPAQRSLCDSCATTLFIISYVCHVCGREYCPDCYEDWTGSGNIRFETCSRNKFHKKDQMIVVVRACKGEIETVLKEMEAFMNSPEQSPGRQTRTDDRSQYKTRDLRDPIFAPVIEFSTSDLDEETFRNIWGMHGHPIVIRDCLERFALPWDPEYFINNHGHEKCTLVQTCPPFNHYETNVARFFEQFGKPHGNGSPKSKSPSPNGKFNHEALKLKDWPPADNFADVFPDLMIDFEHALPEAIAEHVKHNGIYNLASRFPEGYNKPDLGPKMYNAFPATVQMDGRLGGTTNLHRDITDAVNFMMYATSADDDDDKAPGAVWDIFPIGATKHIREYLDKQFPNQPTDPFHRQNCYLSHEDLEILQTEYGVKSYRILQRPGDAVMIPAGCAHQVRNIKDCIKVAVDFLSPENVEICEYLLQENRAIAERANNSSSLTTKKGKESKKMSRVKKEDVLQLWKCLLFYYENIREQLWADIPKSEEKRADDSEKEKHAEQPQEMDQVAEMKDEEAVSRPNKGNETYINTDAEVTIIGKILEERDKTDDQDILEVQAPQNDGLTSGSSNNDTIKDVIIIT